MKLDPVATARNANVIRLTSNKNKIIDMFQNYMEAVKLCNSDDDMAPEPNDFNAFVRRKIEIN